MLWKLSQRPNILDSLKKKQNNFLDTIFFNDVESFRRWLIAFYFRQFDRLVLGDVLSGKEIPALLLRS